MTEIHSIPNAMTHNARLSMKILVSAIAIASIGCMSVPTANAQPTSPSPEATTPEFTSEEPQQNSYIGFGGVIGLQGSTTSLSQGTFSLLSKHVLTENLAIHTANTIFGSSVSSSSAALTFNRPISSDSLPLVFTPFLGGGIMAHYDNGTRISPHITGGVDIGTPTNLTGTIRINAGFVSDRQADIGVVFGVGLNY
jgi:hypothetical protein